MNFRIFWGLGVATFTSLAALGCDGASSDGEPADDDGGSTECPAGEPAEGDACSFSGSCTYDACPAGSISGGFRSYPCEDGVVGTPYADVACRPGSSSSGASTGTGDQGGGGAGGAGGGGAGGAGGEGGEGAGGSD